jgi:hypothetical protein
LRMKGGNVGRWMDFSIQSNQRILLLDAEERS